jgi:hypothetical protein
MIELNTAIAEADLTPAQKLLLQFTRDFIALEKLDLQCQTLRCYPGHGTYPEVVAEELSKLNTNFWPILATSHAAARMKLSKVAHPRSSEEVWKSLEGSVVCLLSPTENYTGGFMRRLDSAKVVGIFHWGG